MAATPSLIDKTVAPFLNPLCLSHADAGHCFEAAIFRAPSVAGAGPDMRTCNMGMLPARTI